ncbi:MAG: Hsp20/alpha crystallin family protein [Methanosarcinales archaeon]|nr:Hsp20/alpha crystallin family protein [Methanosarcinales archaeon]
MYRRRIDPFDELQRMQEWINKAIGDIEPVSGRLLPAIGGDKETVTPSVDIQDTQDKIMVTADVPGVEKEDITVNIHGDILEISAEKKKETEEKGENYIRKERSFSKFYRSISLPTEVDPEKVEATLKDGVLHIEMGKTALTAVKKIEIK